MVKIFVFCIFNCLWNSLIEMLELGGLGGLKAAKWLNMIGFWILKEPETCYRFLEGSIW